jgi:hypothetical protein
MFLSWLKISAWHESSGKLSNTPSTASWFKTLPPLPIPKEGSSVSDTKEVSPASPIGINASIELSLLDDITLFKSRKLISPTTPNFKGFKAHRSVRDAPFPSLTTERRTVFVRSVVGLSVKTSRCHAGISIKGVPDLNLSPET